MCAVIVEEGTQGQGRGMTPKRIVQACVRVYLLHVAVLYTLYNLYCT